MLNIRQSFVPKLIFLCLITTSIVATISLSRYSTKKEGSNSAKVAAFVVAAQGSDTNSLEIDCNDDTPIASYDIIVTNEKNDVISEVAIKYDVIVTFNTALPTDTTISLSTEDTNLSYSGGQTAYKFENVGNFSASNKKNITHSLILEGNTNLKTDYEGTMSITVCSEQID